MRPFLLLLFVQRTYRFLNLSCVKTDRFEYCDFRLFRLVFVLTISALGADIATQKLRNSETQKLRNSETQKLRNSETHELQNAGILDEKYSSK
ncbi:hypothetical protein PEC301899_26880 [Pectobacterium carotovorum subsp. carotovorum]|nr:hypothetical protein PEC301899_26880 [Pectobacterium carotovorum subsp. carotovorum]